MGDLSRDFWRREVQCHGKNCCDHSSPVDRVLVYVLQKMRDECGVALILSCGYRCLVHNRTIGSKDTSQHPLGFAADIQTPEGWTPDRMALVAETIPEIKGIGIYSWGIHIDVRLSKPKRWRQKGYER